MFEELTELSERFGGAGGYVQRGLEYLIAHPRLAVALAVAVALTALVVTLLMQKDLDAPIVRKRRVGAFKMGRWLLAGRRKRRMKRHVVPVIAREYAAEFAAVIGGPGIGKTSRITIPHVARRLLEGLLSVVVLDPKGEVFRETYPLCPDTEEGKGRSGKRSPLVYLYSTLAEHGDDEVCAVDPFANPEPRANFLEVLLPDPPGDDPTWARRARRMLREVSDGLSRLGKRSDLPSSYEALKDPGMLDELARRDAGVAGVWAGQDNKTHESARTEALSPLEGLEDPRIRRVFDSRRCPPGEELGPPFVELSAVYLSVGAADANRAGPLYAGLIDCLQRGAAGRAEGPPVDFVVEEAASYFGIEKLEEYVNLGRGFGVNLLLILQNYDQLKNRLGQHSAASIIGSLDIIVFGRTKSVATGKLLEELSGTTRVVREVPRATPSFWDHLFGNARVQERRRVEDERPRIKAEHLYELPDGHVFVVGGPKLLELVKGVRAQWHRCARRVLRRALPKDSGSAGIRLARPRLPEYEQPEDAGVTCPACASSNPPGSSRCIDCGVGL